MVDATLNAGDVTADGYFEYIVSARVVEQTTRHKEGLYWSYTRSKIDIANVVSPLHKYQELNIRPLLADFWVNGNPVSIRNPSVAMEFDNYVLGDVVYPTQLYIDRAIVQSYLARRDSEDFARTNEVYDSILDELRLRTDFKMIGQEYCVDRAVANPIPVSNSRRRPRLRMMMPAGRHYHSPPPEIPKGVRTLERGRGCWDGSLNSATVATRGEVGALLKELFDLPRALRKLEAYVDYAAIEAEMVESEASVSIKNSDSADDNNGHEDNDDGHNDDGHDDDDDGSVDDDDRYEYDDAL
ncbi:hypothetical protein EXIGLDRAFT_758814 [Exidia glandulosa HHB12029]|uniref:Uncharacterized protein n=1 Tax=Exidia glandulosa HHB12029 TaxID=1314781 RepID=A0A165QDS7_EXIGL|nr:hypothetical protein EXIGLDRAFT_758814 [Exidia glandulosa HHB12029]